MKLIALGVGFLIGLGAFGLAIAVAAVTIEPVSLEGDDD